MSVCGATLDKAISATRPKSGASEGGKLIQSPLLCAANASSISFGGTGGTIPVPSAYTLSHRSFGGVSGEKPESEWRPTANLRVARDEKPRPFVTESSEQRSGSHPFAQVARLREDRGAFYCFCLHTT